MIGYYSVSKEVEPVIKESPSSQGLEIFLQSLGRLQEAMQFFEKNNPQSVELENVVISFHKCILYLKFLQILILDELVWDWER